MSKKFLDFLNSELGEWYEMPQNAQQKIFGDAVENVFCEKGYYPKNGVIELDENTYALPEMAVLVILFKNGKVLSIKTGQSDNILLIAESV